MPQYQRKHEFVIVITTSKPCTSGTTLSAVKNSIHGTFYGDGFYEPEEFRVRRFKRKPKIMR